jgi:hypothetical protein
VVNFLLQAFPLFLGSLLELGEWEVLVLFVGHLGGAEGKLIERGVALSWPNRQLVLHSVGVSLVSVATWAMMGVVWELCAALTEGLGEAASVRVSFLLVEGLPMEARRLSNKVAFLALVLALSLTSMFLMLGPNVAVLLSTDTAIQNLFTDVVGLTGLANVSMTFAQVYWSLAGAQGHFGLASATILFCRWLVILPLASIFIFHFRFDLKAVAGSVAVGYAVAAMVLAWGVFRVDWEQLALVLRDTDGMEDVDKDGLYPMEKVYEDDDDDDDDDDEEDDDDMDEDEEESCTSEDDDEESTSSDNENSDEESSAQRTDNEACRNANDLV